MSLWKRGNVWWAYFYIDGERKQHSTGTGNRKQAEAILQKLKADANAARYQIVQIDPEMTYAALAARFLASDFATPRHVYHLKFLLPYFGDIRIVRLTKNMAAEYRKARMRGRTIKDATVNRDLSVLRHTLYWALDEQLIAANPLTRMRMAPERRIKRQVLSLEEEQKLLAVTPPHLRDMTIATLDTGMRRGEITGQLWEDIDFSRRLLFVTKSKTPEGESREIPLTKRLFDLLSVNRKDHGTVFLYKEEAVRIIKRSWKSALRRAGVRHIRFHDLRHTFNTRLMEAKVMQEVRMALMGHSSGQKVHSTYTHVELPVKREAIAQLEEWVHKQQDSQGGSHADTEKS